MKPIIVPPQGSVLGSVLFQLNTSDIPDVVENTIATFADDTAVLAASNDFLNMSMWRLSSSLRMRTCQEDLRGKIPLSWLNKKCESECSVPVIC